MMVEQGGTQAGQQDALRTAQREIEGVREIMTENIERVLERGEHMSVLVDKTGRLGENARDFRVRSRTLKRRMWWKNVKLMVLLTLVIIFLIYLFVGFGCGLPGKFIVDGRNPCAFMLLCATVSSHGYLPSIMSLVDISQRFSLSGCIRLFRVGGDILKANTFVALNLNLLNKTLTNNSLGTMPRSLDDYQYRQEYSAFDATSPLRSIYDVFCEVRVVAQKLMTSRGEFFSIVYTKGEASGVFPISSNDYLYFQSESIPSHNPIDSKPCRSLPVMPVVAQFRSMHRSSTKHRSQFPTSMEDPPKRQKRSKQK
jgi:hypothetical protein